MRRVTPDFVAVHFHTRLDVRATRAEERRHFHLRERLHSNVILDAVRLLVIRREVDFRVKRALLQVRQDARPNPKSLAFPVLEAEPSLRRERAVRVGVCLEAEQKLFEVVRTLHTSGRLPRRLNRRQEQTDQNPDNRDRDEQLDERKTVRTGKIGTPNAAPASENAETGTASAAKPAKRAKIGTANAATSSARLKPGVNLRALRTLGAALKFNFRRADDGRRRRNAVKIA